MTQHSGLSAAAGEGIHIFSPEDVAALRYALDIATRTLAANGRPASIEVEQALAKSILRHAQAGEQAVDRLSALALTDLRSSDTIGPERLRSPAEHRKQAARYASLAEKADTPLRRELLASFQQARLQEADRAESRVTAAKGAV